MTDSVPYVTPLVTFVTNALPMCFASHTHASMICLLQPPKFTFTSYMSFKFTTLQMSFTWISHLRWLSAQGYCFTGLAGVELGGSKFNCSAVSLHGTPDLNFVCVANALGCIYV